jgi:exodeoxyribonuclease III
VLQPAARDAYRRLLAQGWTDATRYRHPKERIYTYWVNEAAFRRNAGFRMDFLLLSRSLKRCIKDANVDAEYRGGERPSDHAPAWVLLNDEAKPGSTSTVQYRHRASCA